MRKRQCSKCRAYKWDDAFKKDPRRPGKRVAECNVCKREREAQAWAERTRPPGTVRWQPPRPTPYVAPGTLHPVWRCELCNLWESRNGESSGPICFNCSPETEPPENGGAGWVLLDDQVRMVESMRLAPEPVDPPTLCPKCGAPKVPRARTCRPCYLQRIALIGNPGGHHGEIERDERGWFLPR